MHLRFIVIVVVIVVSIAKHRTMRMIGLVLLVASVPAVPLNAAEFHVAVGGDDVNPGTPGAPLRTIQRAADLAQPGDVVTVHAGVYRERVNPPRGGESDAKRIVYQAAPGAAGRDQGIGGRQDVGQDPG
jgi:hypothetical protein